MENLQIQDESNDKKYFTTIPNYIANHSTANDQALYFQMKRYAGENGKCFATQETIMKKMGIGRLAYQKSLKYLLMKKWIKFIGMSDGKTRPIKTYAIVDIWKINIMEYEEIPSRTAVSLKHLKQEIPSETTGDTVQNSSKIPSRTAVEEEPYKQEHINKNPLAANAAGEVFNYNIALKNWVEGNNKIFSLIGKFFRYKKLTFETREQMQIAAKRHLRAAKDLQLFTDEQIDEALNKITQKENLKDEFTLDTILKYLTK